jgi:hypothetical protein
MAQEFSQTFEPYIAFDPDEIVEQRAHAIRHGIARANEQENGDVREETDNQEEEEGDFHNPGDEPPIEEAPRFAMLLMEESRLAFSDTPILAAGVSYHAILSRHMSMDCPGRKRPVG